MVDKTGDTGRIYFIINKSRTNGDAFIIGYYDTISGVLRRTYIYDDSVDIVGDEMKTTYDSVKFYIRWARKKEIFGGYISEEEYMETLFLINL